jgi:hypothetical protein
MSKLAEPRRGDERLEIRLEAVPSTQCEHGETITVHARPDPDEPGPGATYEFEWLIKGPAPDDAFVPIDGATPETRVVHLSHLLEGKTTIQVKLMRKHGAHGRHENRVESIDLIVATRKKLMTPTNPPPASSLPVTLERTANPPTNDLPLWIVIRKSAQSLSFDHYSRFMELVLCKTGPSGHLEKSQAEFEDLRKRRFLPYNEMDAYRLLKVATEAFVVVNCAIAAENSLAEFKFTPEELNHMNAWVDLGDPGFGMHELHELWKHSLRDVNVNGSTMVGGTPVEQIKTILYLKLIRDKLPDVRLKNSIFAAENAEADLPEQCYGILTRKLTRPCLLELIWSYWHEEAMLVQTMNAISLRFQNIQAPGSHNPLAMLEIDPLRPLNNLIWGFIQDEQHRLSLVRRTYEYDHHYGLTLQGKAVPNMRPADSRSRFLEVFHNLLYLTSIFFKEDDDTTFKADGFPLLNALKEVHLLLGEGAHNQFGDLPSTARQEMLIQQWILARPEFREYLPTRIMVALPEAWMDRVDAMKSIQGWTDASVLYFHNLGYFGEQILLSIRFGAWSAVNDSNKAANWARFWRAELQGYTYAYRTVTGVDLTAEISDSQQSVARYLQPAVHLARRLADQRGGHPALAASSNGVLAAAAKMRRVPRSPS